MDSEWRLRNNSWTHSNVLRPSCFPFFFFLSCSDNDVISTAKFTVDAEDCAETEVINNAFFGEGTFK